MINFALLSLAEFDHFILSLGGWGWVCGWGKIEIKDQLSLAEAEVWVELGNNLNNIEHSSLAQTPDFIQIYPN